MSWIDPEDLKALRAQADIVDIISSYIPVEKKGKEYVAVCPFHDDHNPSLSISPSKQIYKCFTCGAGGDVFRFVAEYEKIPYTEAVRVVADKVHFPLKNQGNAVVRQDPMAREHALLDSYIQFGRYELYSQDGLQALEYLHSRKISDELIETFQLGLAPSSRQTMHFLTSKQLDPVLCGSLGLTRTNEYGTKAVFENRILIPIHDFWGKPVGFSARRLNEQEDPKYINTSATPLYSKSHLIFNYHRARPAAVKARRVILCEGAMDVIGLAKAGIQEAVACLGTALSDEQLNGLRQMNVPVVVFYDADRAGKEATYKFGQKAAQAGLPFTIVNNTLGKDPDEVFNSAGKDEVLALVERTISWPEFLFQWLPQIYNLENYDDLKTFSRQMKEAIDPIPDGFERNALFERLRQKTGFDYQFEEPKHRRRRKQQQEPSMPLTRPVSGLQKAEESALYIMLHSRAASRRFQESIGFFQNEVCSALSIYIYDIYRSKDQLDLDELMAMVEEEDVRALLERLVLNPYNLNPGNPDLFSDILNKIKDCTLEARIEAINQEMASISDPVARVKKAMEKKDLIAQRHEVRSRKEG